MPANGMYWLRKGSKQPVLMKNDVDFEVGKKEYSGSNSMRIACTAVDVDTSSPGKSRQALIPLNMHFGFL